MILISAMKVVSGSRCASNTMNVADALPAVAPSIIADSQACLPVPSQAA